MVVGVGHVEAGVDHAEPCDQPLPQHGAQRATRHHLDDPPEHFGGMAVLPDRAGLVRSGTPASRSAKASLSTLGAPTPAAA